MTPLTCWLQSLDHFNRLAPALEREDGDDLIWPGKKKQGWLKAHLNNELKVRLSDSLTNNTVGACISNIQIQNAY